VAPDEGRRIFQFLTALADFERVVIKSRVVEGLESARARGRIGGRPTKLTSKKIEEARRIMSGGLSVAKTAEIIGVSKSTLNNSIRPEPEAEPAGPSA
jgi:DNA invertase Pin-like site-specific DNA recombinase